MFYKFDTVRAKLICVSLNKRVCSILSTTFYAIDYTKALEFCLPYEDLNVFSHLYFHNLQNHYIKRTIFQEMFKFVDIKFCCKEFFIFKLHFYLLE